MRDKIKEQKIVAIDEDINHWSDNYFTGAIIKGSSELKVTYTREDFFVSAKYTFVGRSNPALIGKIKNKLAERYGPPTKQTGIENTGPASFEWFLDDGIHLTVNRFWPDTTTYVVYTCQENKQLLAAQQEQSNTKTFKPNEQEQEKLIESYLF